MKINDDANDDVDNYVGVNDDASDGRWWCPWHLPSIHPIIILKRHYPRFSHLWLNDLIYIEGPLHKWKGVWVVLILQWNCEAFWNA